MPSGHDRRYATHGSRASDGTRSGRRLARSSIAAWALLASGCGTVYVNPEDEFPRYEHERSFVSERGVERTYRRLYDRLLECTSAYYRVRGALDKKTSTAVLSLDTGAGFERTLYLADAHVLRVDIEPREGSKSTVSVSINQREPPPFVALMPRWVNEDYDACRE